MPVASYTRSAFQPRIGRSPTTGRALLRDHPYYGDDDVYVRHQSAARRPGAAEIGLDEDRPLHFQPAGQLDGVPHGLCGITVFYQRYKRHRITALK
jgi:hypothetical protein